MAYSLRELHEGAVASFGKACRVNGADDKEIRQAKATRYLIALQGAGRRVLRVSILIGGSSVLNSIKIIMR